MKFYIEPDYYEKLKRLAAQQRTTVPQLVRRLVLEYLGEIEDEDLVIKLKELEAKYEQIAKELGRVEKDLALLAKRCSKK